MNSISNPFFSSSIQWKSRADRIEFAKKSISTNTTTDHTDKPHTANGEETITSNTTSSGNFAITVAEFLDSVMLISLIHCSTPRYVRAFVYNYIHVNVN